MTELATRRFASRPALESALEERLARAIAAPAAAALMLSGGTTPLPVYRALAARPRIPHGAGLRILFTDDRYVAVDSPVSNYHQAQPLLAALDLAPDAVLRVRTELPLEEAAGDYDRRLTALIRSGTPIGLGLLGLGADGHTASLFSSADLERSHGRLAIPVQRPDGLSAVSVTPEFLAGIGEPLFVVAGPGKSEALARLARRDPGLIAWRAVQGCASVELWIAGGS